MINFSILDRMNYPPELNFLKKADDGLAPLRIIFNKSDEKTYHIGVKALSVLATILTLPIVVISLAVKCWKREELQKLIAHHPQLKEEEEEKEQISPKSKEAQQHIQALEKEFRKIRNVEQKLPEPLAGTWRSHGKKKGEKPQSFGSYVKATENSYQVRDWPIKSTLYIQKMGQFDDNMLKILKITLDYLHIFYNLPIKQCPKELTMQLLVEKYLAIIPPHNWILQTIKETLPKKDEQSGHKQFDAAFISRIIELTLIPELEERENPQIMAFTDQDLYMQDYNFVFGCAHGKTGIWSYNRFGNASSSPKAFKLCLLRMMKLAIHEFGHMLNIDHCTDYECNMGGYMNIKELDERILIFCPEDMRKICYLTKRSLLDMHKAIFKYLNNFNQNYKVDCDFSKELSILGKRIKVLNSRNNLQ
jgi:archaemetzincin